MDLGVSGLASGFDWRTLVDQLTELNRTPQKFLLTEQDLIQQRNIAYGSLITELSVLKNRIDALKDNGLYNQRLAALSNYSVASVSAGASTPVGSYAFAFSQLATAAVQQGATNAGAALNATDEVSGLVLSNAAFSTAVTAGTFTVNGNLVTVNTSDTLQGVFDKISAATSGAVTGSYSAATDKITLSSASAITLGSAADTGNFLQVSRLSANGSGTVTSAFTLGSLKLGAVLSAANFSTAISDGGSGAGEFKINGVSISFNASTDSLATVMGRINDSAAGVIAQYDAINDRLTLTNKTSGDISVSLQDVTGNFLAAAKLTTGAGGTLQSGKDLLYTVNGGPQLNSRSNTVTEASHGIAGLAVTALQVTTPETVASVTATVTSDSSGVKTAIGDFIAQYNKVQQLIDSQTASTTDEKGKVTAGILAGDRDIAAVASQLRGRVFGPITGLSGTINQLAKLGYSTNGNDDTLALSDSTALDSALTNNLSGIKDFFSNASSGLGVTLSTYVESIAGDDGTLVSHQTTLTKQSTDIDPQIAELERIVQANRQRLIDSFVAMEKAQAQTNQQLQFLLQRFGTSG